MKPIDVKSLTEEELTRQLTGLGYPAFRARQVKSWLDKGCASFQDMRNLPAALRDQL